MRRRRASEPRRCSPESVFIPSADDISLSEGSSCITVQVGRGGAADVVVRGVLDRGAQRVGRTRNLGGPSLSTSKAEREGPARVSPRTSSNDRGRAPSSEQKTVRLG